MLPLGVALRIHFVSQPGSFHRQLEIYGAGQAATILHHDRNVSNTGLVDSRSDGEREQPGIRTTSGKDNTRVRYQGSVV